MNTIQALLADYQKLLQQTEVDIQNLVTKREQLRGAIYALNTAQQESAAPTAAADEPKSETAEG